MFLTVHATAAVIISKKIASPWLAFLIGYLSHFLLDALPHGDDAVFNRFGGKKFVRVLFIAALIDSAIGLLWLIFLFGQNKLSFQLNTLAAVAGSVLPDILTGIFLLTNSKLIEWNHNLNRNAHRWLLKEPLPATQGFGLQFIFWLLLVVILFTL